MEDLETNNIHPKPFWLLQVTHSICALGLGSLCFTLAFPSLSIFQIPINFYIHKKYYQKIKRVLHKNSRSSSIMIYAGKFRPNKIKLKYKNLISLKSKNYTKFYTNFLIAPPKNHLQPFYHKSFLVYQLDSQLMVSVDL